MQGKSGLGLEAQRAAVKAYVAGIGGGIIAEFMEIESGRNCERPRLAAALNLCQVAGAKLVIARLDRLARNVHFISGLMEKEVDFVATDLPNATPFMLHIYAAVAQEESRAISARTKAALAARKARGLPLGAPKGHSWLRQFGNAAGIAGTQKSARRRAERLAPIIDDVRASGVTSLRGIATELNARSIPSPRRGRWHATTVDRLLHRIDYGGPKDRAPKISSPTTQPETPADP
jgi:DNA invertase Pin-like site-specific DNA recombinase